MKNKNLIYQILISFVLVSVLTNMACLFIRNSVIQQEKLKAEYTVNSTINRVEIKLESYIEKVGFLKKTIELAPNGIIQNVYPFKENQKAIGMNMLAEYERKEAATLAKDTRKYTLEGPYDLKQGGKGALLYDPIYVNGEFWGFSIFPTFFSINSVYPMIAFIGVRISCDILNKKRDLAALASCAFLASISI